MVVIDQNSTVVSVVEVSTSMLIISYTCDFNVGWLVEPPLVQVSVVVANIQYQCNVTAEENPMFVKIELNTSWWSPLEDGCGSRKLC